MLFKKLNENRGNYADKETHIKNVKQVLKDLIEKGYVDGWEYEEKYGINADEMGVILFDLKEGADLEIWNDYHSRYIPDDTDPDGKRIEFRRYLTMDPEWREIAKKRYMKK